jgi:pantoate--beta-alanine ligase
MLVCNSITEIRQKVAGIKRNGQTISFVPTMGNLHEGHLQLVKLARQHGDIVVVSIFVNEMQFGANEDFGDYPRTLAADQGKLEREGADILFFPSSKDIYPDGLAGQTAVTVPGLTDSHCGASRPGHFTGVTTVVTKLFNIVQPDSAIFGLKDFQQLTVIRRMVEDLNQPVTIIEAPIARAEDGLALSSRNGYLTAEERERAPTLYRCLLQTRQAILEGQSDFQSLEESAREQLHKAGFQPDYYSICNRDSLQAAQPRDKNLVVLAAAYLGKTRLLDNVTLAIP